MRTEENRCQQPQAIMSAKVEKVAILEGEEEIYRQAHLNNRKGGLL